MWNEGLRDVLSLEFAFALSECKGVWLSKEVAHELVVIRDVRILEREEQDPGSAEEYIALYSYNCEYPVALPLQKKGKPSRVLQASSSINGTPGLRRE